MKGSIWNRIAKRLKGVFVGAFEILTAEARQGQTQQNKNKQSKQVKRW